MRRGWIVRMRRNKKYSNQAHISKFFEKQRKNLLSNGEV
jgi:hypothetical protein